MSVFKDNYKHLSNLLLWLNIVLSFNIEQENHYEILNLKMALYTN